MDGILGATSLLLPVVLMSFTKALADSTLYSLYLLNFLSNLKKVGKKILEEVKMQLNQQTS